MTQAMPEPARDTGQRTSSRYLVRFRIVAILTLMLLGVILAVVCVVSYFHPLEYRVTLGDRHYAYAHVCNQSLIVVWHIFNDPQDFSDDYWMGVLLAPVLNPDFFSDFAWYELDIEWMLSIPDHFGLDEEFKQKGLFRRAYTTYSRLQFPLGPLAVLLLIPWAYVTLSTLLRIRRRKRLNQCHDCGYSRQGNVSDICPECGALGSASSPVPWRQAILFAVIALIISTSAVAYGWYPIDPFDPTIERPVATRNEIVIFARMMARNALARFDRISVFEPRADHFVKISDDPWWYEVSGPLDRGLFKNSHKPRWRIIVEVSPPAKMMCVFVEIDDIPLLDVRQSD